MHDTDSSATMKKWEGRWDQLVGKVKSTWGDFTDDDITQARGDYRQLLGRIKEKYGESVEEIERKLDREDD